MSKRKRALSAPQAPLHSFPLCQVSSFLSAAECERIIDICEAVHGGWVVESQDQYLQTTADLEVDRVPALKTYLLETINFMPRLQAHYIQQYSQKITAFDDLFVVKYDARAQRELVKHVDAGDVSFMIALSSPPRDFTGGGTLFPELNNRHVDCDKGDILTFPAKLWHQGVPITKGCRYLLVGFCFLNSVASKTPGNLDLTMKMIPAPAHVVSPLPRTWELNLSSTQRKALKKDVKIIFKQAGQESYWVSPLRPPRCSLEELALKLFHLHSSADDQNQTGQSTEYGQQEKTAETEAERKDSIQQRQQQQDIKRDKVQTGGAELWVCNNIYIYNNHHSFFKYVMYIYTNEPLRYPS